MNADGKYHIRSVLLGFSKLLGKLVEKYVSTCTKGYTLKKKKGRTGTYLMMLMLCFVCFFLY